MKAIKLTVKDRKHKDKYGVHDRIARIDTVSREKVGITIGEVIEIIGKTRTVALVVDSLQKDKSKGVIRIDSFIRKSAGLTLGKQAIVQRASVKEAIRIVLAPIDIRLNTDEDFINFVKKRALINRPFCEGDYICTTLLEHFIPFRVIHQEPHTVPAIVTNDTLVEIMNQPAPSPESIAIATTNIKYLLRFDWLNSLVSRTHANRILFSIMDSETSDENETVVVEAARKIADKAFSSVKIMLTLASDGNVIGTLPWAEVDMYGIVFATYPDIELPPTSPTPLFVSDATFEGVSPPMRRCFKTGTPRCPKKISFSPKTVVVAMPFEAEFEDAYRYAIRPALEEAGFKPWKADEQISNIDIMCKICHAIQESGYLLANITTWNANVVFELGLAYGLGRKVILIKHRKAGVPVDLKGLEYIEYGSIDELKRNLLLFLKGASAAGM